MGSGRAAAGPPDAGPRGTRFHCCQDRQPRSVLGGVPRRLSRGERDHEHGRRAPPATRHSPWLRPDLGTDRRCISSGALPCLPAYPGAIRGAARLRPVRLWLGFVRNGGVSGQYRSSRRALCLVRSRDFDCYGPHRRRLFGRCQSTPDFRLSAGGTALAGAADCVDGDLYLFEPLHSLRADCRAPPGGAADSDAGGNRHSRRLAGSRARDWPGHSARLKLTYRVLGSAFHDGTEMKPADLLYAYMFAYRWGDSGDAEAHHDPEVAAATAPLRKRLVAVRLAGVDAASKSFRVGDVNFIRELFAIDVYLDIPPEDPEQDAVFSPPWSTLPWHLTVLMEEAVGRGWAAFSQTEAMRRGVEWLDLVRSDGLKTRLAALVDQFEQHAFRPAILQSLVSAEEARKRWAALSAFYRSHGHFLVTNGPYQLKSWSGNSVSVEAFRDLSYPLGVGSYDTYAIPRRGYVTKVERE